MEYLDSVGCDTGKILCCQCGTPIDPNPSNMCVGCIRTQVDITEGIPKQVTIYFCKGCERYHQPPSCWVFCSLESKELMALCLKKLKTGLSQVRLIDASFVWTEPHSKRIKVKLTVQKEVIGGAVLQQVFVVEYTVVGQMCDDCRRVEAKDYWKAMVQVRQKVDNKKTFYYLEQLILKHRAHEHTLGIKPSPDGLDFMYASEANAKKFLDFLVSVVPCKYQNSKKLISHDNHSNIYNYKYTYSVEIAPVCKDDIVCLSRKFAHSLGGMNQLCVVTRVSSSIHLIDPSSGQIADLSSNQYWRNPFQTLCSSKKLQEYMVMNIEVIDEPSRAHFGGQGKISHKHCVADVWVVKTSEVGMSSDTIHTRTHLGHLLKPGDSVLGFDVANSNINDSNFDALKRENVSDVILVKKIFGEKSVRNRIRKWKLRHIDEIHMETGSTGSHNRDYTDFLEDLEEDEAYRQNINIYRDRARINVEVPDYNEEIPQITLQEMLEDLCLDDDEMKE